MRRDTPWDWIIALAGLCFVLAVVAWMTSKATECNHQGGTYADVGGLFRGRRILRSRG